MHAIYVHVPLSSLSLCPPLWPCAFPLARPIPVLIASPLLLRIPVSIHIASLTPNGAAALLEPPQVRWPEPPQEGEVLVRGAVRAQEVAEVDD